MAKRSISPYYRLPKAAKTNKSHQWFFAGYILQFSSTAPKKCTGLRNPVVSLISFKAIWSSLKEKKTSLINLGKDRPEIGRNWRRLWKDQGDGVIKQKQTCHPHIFPLDALVALGRSCLSLWSSSHRSSVLYILILLACWTSVSSSLSILVQIVLRVPRSNMTCFCSSLLSSLHTWPTYLRCCR